MSEPAARTYKTRHGPMLAFKGDMYITRSLEVYGEFSGSEWRLLEQLAKPGMPVVEIGANIGAHTVALARRCAPGPLYAFEPQQRVFQLLCANLANNGVENVIAWPEACGESEGVALIPPLDYAGLQNFGGVSLQQATPGRSGTPVRVRPLDDLNLQQCGLIKIDVEGFEPQVLRGARETIARCRPVLYVENDRPDQQQEVISLIAEMGYRQYWHTPSLFDPGNFNGVAEDVFGRIVSLNLLCVPSEQGTKVEGVQEIDPTNWTSPVKMRP
jgi:FkbM family methyltransferase